MFSIQLVCERPVGFLEDIRKQKEGLQSVTITFQHFVPHEKIFVLRQSHYILRKTLGTAGHVNMHATIKDSKTLETEASSSTKGMELREDYMEWIEEGSEKTTIVLQKSTTINSQDIVRNEITLI